MDAKQAERASTALGRSGRSKKRHQIAFKQGGELDGIIAFLTDRCGGNVMDKGVVDVVGNPYDERRGNSLRNIVDLKENSRFSSINEPNQSICYDFKKNRVTVTHYVIRSDWNGGVGYGNLKSWIIEVSMQGSNWIEVDRRVNNKTLNDMNAMQWFAVANANEEAKFVRIRQIDKNCGGNSQIVLSSFELFGTLTLS
jgi:hypothetical protein